MSVYKKKGKNWQHTILKSAGYEATHVYIKNYSLYITNARWKRRRNKRKNQTARYFRHIRTSTSPYKYPWSVSWLHVFRTKPWLFQPTHAVLRRNWRQYHNKIIFSWNLDYTLSSQRYNKEMKINAEWRKNIIQYKAGICGTYIPIERHVHMWNPAPPKTTGQIKKRPCSFLKRWRAFLKTSWSFYCHRKFAIFHRGIPPSDTLFAKKKPENILLHIKSEQLIKKYILLITNRLYEILLQKTVRAWEHKWELHFLPSLYK